MLMAEVVSKFVLLLLTIMLTKSTYHHIFSYCKEGPLFFFFGNNSSDLYVDV